MATALLIINPTARSGRSHPGLLDKAMATLRHQGLHPEIATTQHAGQARDLAQASRAELIVAVGGDGTVNEVASGLLQHPPPTPLLAVLPAGTGNDVARLLGVASPEAAIAALEGRRVTRWDVIEIECSVDGRSVRRHALLFAGAGFVGEVIRQTTPRVKAWCGPTLSYAVGFFRALMRQQAAQFRVRGPDLDYEGPLLTALAANASHAGGGGMRLGPGARMDDGLFDVSIIRSVGRREVARQFLRLTRGTHIRHPAVDYFPATWLEIDANTPSDVVADGELVGTTPARFTLLPKALPMVRL